MNAAFEDSALDILEEFGDMNAVFTSDEVTPVVKTIPALVDYNTQIVGDEFNVMSGVTSIHFLKSSGINPHRGDTIQTDGRTFKIDSVLSEDSIWVKVIVK